MEKCLEKIKEKNLDIKLKNNIRLKRMCEIAKIKLSTCDSTQIILEEYAPNIPIYFSLIKMISINIVNLYSKNLKIY